MDIRSREAALKRRNDELDACQTLYGNDDTTPSTCIQDQSFDTPLLSRQSSAQDVGSNKSHVDLIPAKTTLRVSYFESLRLHRKPLPINITLTGPSIYTGIYIISGPVQNTSDGQNVTFQKE